MSSASIVLAAVLLVGVGATLDADTVIAIQADDQSINGEDPAPLDPCAERRDSQECRDYCELRIKGEETITCPFMRALVKNCDLVPGDDKKVSKQQTFDAMLRVGISEKVAKQTTDANFQTPASKETAGCMKCPERINLFAMATIPADCKNHDETAFPKGCRNPDAKIKCTGCTSPDGQPQQHFRSTGICDRGCANGAGLFRFAKKTCLGDKDVGIVENKCVAALWDREIGFPPSSNVDEAKRPDVKNLATNEMRKCQKTDSKGATGHRLPTLVEAKLDETEEKCPSQIHGSIQFLFEVFGTIRESLLAKIPQTEYENLWLKGEYTTAFKNRSPRFCIGHPNEKRSTNCKKCKRQANRIAKKAKRGEATQDEKDVAEERYCLCVNANVRDPAERNKKQKARCGQAASGSFTLGNVDSSRVVLAGDTGTVGQAN